ncbi:MAG: PLP-dependent aminotransferase family protein [Firmicutes bacterium]|nr:PLP-dependent aminotransferase family protein [Bacillota bacterium]
MRTYSLQKAPGLPLYESLYRALRQDILDGTLRKGEKLPSKRALAAHLQVSKVTVETAYAHLVEEGYLTAVEKRGYFVDFSPAVPPVPAPVPAPVPVPAPAPEAGRLLDFTANDAASFPFWVWRRLQREVMLDYGEALLRPLPSQGAPELRQAIAAHLAAFRGMQVDAQNILVGAGTDFLYNLLVQLLGRDRLYAVEEPGYGKIRSIYRAAGAEFITVPMDGEGVRPDALGASRVLHLSPAHHFPTGTVTSLARRRALLQWAERAGAIVIEDDYDSEFRLRAHPLPAMQSLDPARVIYMNSFTKTLAPSIRIGYAVLPEPLSRRFREELGFYGCTVPSFEQYTLARFLREGYFEKHINRMRKFYARRRALLLDALRACPMADRMEVLESEAGLHLIVRLQTDKPDDELADAWLRAGIRVRCLSEFFSTAVPDNARRCLVLNYSGLDERELSRLNHLEF